MSRHCEECRRELWRCLAGRPHPARLAELALDRHVLTCSSCRDLLKREEALELLLASLPEPRLPCDLAGRVIARLRASLEPSGVPERVSPEPAGDARCDELDRVLECVAAPRVPPHLARRVLADLAPARVPDVVRLPALVPLPRPARQPRIVRDPAPVPAAGLDALLDRLPVPEPPRELRARLQDALAPHRRTAAGERPPRPLRRQLLAGTRWVAAAAAVLVAWAGARWIAGDPPGTPTELAGFDVRGAAESGGDLGDRPDGRAPTLAAAESSLGDAEPPDDELLAHLDLLENWELVVDADLEVLLSSVDSVDELLLDVELEPQEGGEAAGAGSGLDSRSADPGGEFTHG